MAQDPKDKYLDFKDKILNEFIKNIKITIDNLGTGYSSYNHLSDLFLNHNS